MRTNIIHQPWLKIYDVGRGRKERKHEGKEISDISEFWRRWRKFSTPAKIHIPEREGIPQDWTSGGLFFPNLTSLHRPELQLKWNVIPDSLKQTPTWSGESQIIVHVTRKQQWLASRHRFLIHLFCFNGRGDHTNFDIGQCGQSPKYRTENWGPKIGLRGMTDYYWRPMQAIIRVRSDCLCWILVVCRLAGAGVRLLADRGIG